MWGNRELLERFESLSGRFQDMDEFVSKELQRQRDKIALLEKEIVERKWLKHRVKTLDSQVNDLMNREEEWKRRLAKIETGMIVDQMKVDGVWKEEPKEVELEPRVGDLVVSTENPTDIRKVLANGYGLQMVGKTDIKMYNRLDLVKDVMSDWKVIARREDLK